LPPFLNQAKSDLDPIFNMAAKNICGEYHLVYKCAHFKKNPVPIRCDIVVVQDAHQVT